MSENVRLQHSSDLDVDLLKEALILDSDLDFAPDVDTQSSTWEDLGDVARPGIPQDEMDIIAMSRVLHPQQVCGENHCTNSGRVMESVLIWRTKFHFITHT